MQISDLKSPGQLSNSIQLRTAAYKALAYASIQSDLSGGTSDTGKVLAEFFADCAKRAQAYSTPVKKEAAK